VISGASRTTAAAAVISCSCRSLPGRGKLGASLRSKRGLTDGASPELLLGGSIFPAVQNFLLAPGPETEGFA
jgi:hypothetical protein